MDYSMASIDQSDLVRIRRELHMYPELSNCEDRTMNLVCDYLDQLHIPYTKM